MPTTEATVLRNNLFINGVISSGIDILETLEEDTNNGWEYNDSIKKILKLQIIVNGQNKDWLYRSGDNGIGMILHNIIEEYIPLGRHTDRAFGSRNLFGRGAKDSAAYGEKIIKSLKDGQFSQADMQPHKYPNDNVGASKKYENDNHLSSDEKLFFNEMISAGESDNPSGTLVETKIKKKFSKPPSYEDVVNHLKNSFKSFHIVNDENTELHLEYIDKSRDKKFNVQILPSDDLWVDIETKSKSIDHNNSSRKIDFIIKKIDQPQELSEEIQELNKKKIIRPWGFFVGYELDGLKFFLDNVLGAYENQIDGLDIMKNYKIHVICPHLKVLQQNERIGTTQSIIKGDRSGLNPNHTFVRKLNKEIKLIRTEIIQQERSSQSGLNQTAPALNKLFESASAEINKNLLSGLAVINELTLSEPIEFRPPSPFLIREGQEKTITIYAKNDLQPQVTSNSSEEVVKVITRPNSWNNVEDISDYEKSTFTLKGLRVGTSDIEFSSGNTKKVYQITVSSHVEIEFEPEFEFSPPSKNLLIGKDTKIRLWCSPEIAESIENFHDGPEISASHEEIEIISGNRNWNVDDSFGLYFLDITVKATKKVGRASKFIQAKIADKEAKCKISISEVDKIWTIDIIDKKKLLDLGREGQIFSQQRPVYADTESDSKYNILKVYLNNKAFGKLPKYDSTGDWSKTKEDQEIYKKLNVLIALECVDEISRYEIRQETTDDGKYKDVSGFEDIEPMMMKDRTKWYQVRNKFLENENWES